MGIDFQNVSFKYDKKASNHALKNVNLKINSKNEFITIIGHTGSGKSTLTQLANALIAPSEGRIVIFGKTIKPKRNKNLKIIRKQVGLVFQFPEYQLFEETVIKDVMFGPKNFGKKTDDAKEDAKKACSLVGIDEDMYERAPFTLSGGQMRRVAIAGILASEPEILIFDEPTVGLDPQGKKELLELLSKIHHDTSKTIIIVTHDMDIVSKYASRVIVLNNGEIVFDGKKEVLFKDMNKVISFNLDLPEPSKLAVELKKRKLIDYDTLPLTIEELYTVIKRGNNHE